MKQFKNLVLLFAVAFVAVLSLTSCISSSTTSISIQEMPKTTFELGEDVEGTLLTLNVIDGETSASVIIKYEKGQVVVENPLYSGQILLSGFRTDKVGSYTAVITFKGATSYFDYEVIDPASGFSGGNGTVNNPYQITEAEQLELIYNDLDAHYKLMNDLDLQSVKINKSKGEAYNGAGWDVLVLGVFEGTFDGNGKKLYNITNSFSIFEGLKDAEIKNLNIYINTTSVWAVTIECRGNVTFNNVNAYGVLDEAEGNTSIYTLYAGYGDFDEVTKFIDCYNEVKMYSLEKFGGFVGGINDEPVGNDLILFENCEFAGHIEGAYVGAFIGNANSDTAKMGVKFVDTVVTGTLLGTTRADAIAGYGTLVNCETQPEYLEKNLVTLQYIDFDEIASVSEWNAGKLVLKAGATINGSEVKEVKVIASLAAKMDEGQHIRTIVKLYELSDEQTITEFIKAGYDEQDVADGKDVFYIGEGKYIFNKGNESNYEYKGVNSTSLEIFCYDENGVLLGATKAIGLNETQAE